MKKVIEVFQVLSKMLDRFAAGNAVVAKPISIGDRHVLPLCELSLGWAGAGGEGDGEGDESGKGRGSGTGGGGGGSAKANPVALIVVENGKVRLESLEG